MSSNIVLIGFMGSGKSTVGRLLAKKTGKYFIDTDAMIESATGRKIRDIFSSSGESTFREMEKELLVWLESNIKNAVISTGGGMPTVAETFKKLGQCFYLQIGFEELLERLKAEEFDKRPLFQDVEFARKIFDSRLPLYAKHADKTIEANTSPEAICEQIKKLV